MLFWKTRKFLASTSLLLLAIVVIFGFQNCGRMTVLDSGQFTVFSSGQSFMRLAGNEALFYPQNERPAPELVMGRLGENENHVAIYFRTCEAQSPENVFSMTLQLVLIKSECMGPCPADPQLSKTVSMATTQNGVTHDPYYEACVRAGGNAFEMQTMSFLTTPNIEGYVAQMHYTYNGSYKRIPDVSYYINKNSAVAGIGTLDPLTCADKSVGTGNCVAKINSSGCEALSQQTDKDSCLKFCDQSQDGLWTPYDKAYKNICKFNNDFIYQKATEVNRTAPECVGHANGFPVWKDMNETVSIKKQCDSGSGAYDIYKQEREFKCESGQLVATGNKRQSDFVQTQGACFQTNCAAHITAIQIMPHAAASKTDCWNFCQAHGNWTADERKNWNLCWYGGEFIYEPGANAAAGNNCTACVNPNGVSCESKPTTKTDTEGACVDFCKQQDSQMQSYFDKGWSTCYFKGAPVPKPSTLTPTPTPTPTPPPNNGISTVGSGNCSALVTTTSQEKSQQSSQTSCWNFCSTKGSWTESERKDWNLCYYKGSVIRGPGTNVASGNNCAACVNPGSSGCASQPATNAASKEECINFCKSKDSNMQSYFDQDWSTCWYNGEVVSSKSKTNPNTATKKCTACVNPDGTSCESKPVKYVASKDECISFCRASDSSMDSYWDQGWNTCFMDGQVQEP